MDSMRKMVLGKFLNFSTSLYEAEISTDLILSFSWLNECELDLKARKYGLQTSGDPSYFIPGTTQPKMGRANEVKVRIVQVRHIKVSQPVEMGMDLEEFQRCFTEKGGTGFRGLDPFPSKSLGKKKI